mmetsp:Transcript_21602/g.42434  ORF Transcript_21602/g.42434 Transcript_21602/m.42434 type:complete len:424 (+) Transcript_21602:183-1454(+)|eukprot:CAMPEP_0171573994 /NCGR_PEP_ID=MMETSP0961-20121227/5087_1 /TAXON_ID=87120 /ORGANISM="Aurantiochytrium limacinum, Strain ATCCMYA-1381" /LENGTH=423 /DNA_ID=CAMNT_0012129213 /DNA_START=129 /DNA_END=1400 /DNA_ORIENTATION=-
MKKSPQALEPFGDQLTFAEPYWCQGFPSPYYKKSHVEFRNKVRAFVEKEIMPHLEDWLDANELYPLELHTKAYEAGISGVLYPTEWGGTRPDDFDSFHELILWQELARPGGGGALGQLSINSMALPPIMRFASDYIKQKVLRDVITGKKNCSLMISEPWAGSDVANIRTTARREGDYYIVDGEKKWITGSLIADYWTCLVRTGGEGAGGLSCLLIEKNMPGIKIRKMKTQFDNTHNTCQVSLNEVKVPVENLIGEEGKGFTYLTVNFNHERFVIAAGTCMSSRLCYQEAFHEAMTRKTFGQKLIDSQIIRFKLAEMARQIEALQDHLERIAYAFSNGVPDAALGPQCALLKVQASKTFEYCAREAVQVFGGSGLVSEGRGRKVERLYREVRGAAIPGGSEEILADFAIRRAYAEALKSKSSRI